MTAQYDPRTQLMPFATEITDTKVTDYVGNKIYENGKLIKILVDGGYYDTRQEKYYFYIQDHLGNNRVLADAQGNVVQRSDYYPFGMEFADNTGQDEQPYKYNGKELDKLHGLNIYDYSARYMEPAIGRFTSVDPLAEKYYSISPYVYCANNPLKYIDPDGRYIDPIYDTDGNLLGTDNKGLEGNFIVMNKKNFSQGMSHKEALSKNLGASGLKDKESISKLATSFVQLKDRPDYDGKLTCQ